MKISDLFIFIFLALVLGFFGYIIADIIGAIIFATIVTYFFFTIICWIKYGKKYGVYRLPAFCIEIYNSAGELIAGFKGDDWTVLENPVPITSKESLTVKVKKEDNTMEEKILELDYRKMLREYVDKALQNIIPNPEKYNSNPINPETQKAQTIVTEKMTFEKALENAVRKTGDLELLQEIQKLSYEEKVMLAKLMRQLLACHLIPVENLKVYKITSLTNEVFLFWIAQAEPQQYQTKTEKTYFRKYKVWLSRKGLPVVEVWGAEMRTSFKGKLMPITYEIQGYELKCFFCLPIQDERYRYLKLLLMQQYDIIASAISKYVQEMLEALPYITRVDLLTKECEVYKEEVEILREGIQRIYGEISELSGMIYSSLALVTQLSGLLTKIPLPKETKEKLAQLGYAVEEQKGRIEKLAGAIKRLIVGKTEEKPKPIEIEKIETKEKEETTSE